MPFLGMVLGSPVSVPAMVSVLSRSDWLKGLSRRGRQMWSRDVCITLAVQESHQARHKAHESARPMSDWLRSWPNRNRGCTLAGLASKYRSVGPRSVRELAIDDDEVIECDDATASIA